MPSINPLLLLEQIDQQVYQIHLKKCLLALHSLSRPELPVAAASGARPKGS